MEKDWERMGTFVAARRGELDLTQEVAAKRARMSPTTWRKVEAGSQTTYRAGTLARVSKALGMPPDTLSRIASDELPPVVTVTADQDPGWATYEVTKRLRRLAGEIDELTEMMGHVQESLRRQEGGRFPDGDG